MANTFKNKVYDGANTSANAIMSVYTVPSSTTTVVIGLTGRAAQAAGYQTLTLAVSTSTGSAVNPTLVTGQDNPLVGAVRGAMTSNPGGVVTTCSLGNDQAATPVQMYWRTATYA